MNKQLPYIFLPTDKASNIFLNTHGKMCCDNLTLKLKKFNNQFAYILSDETPKENDWVYGMDGVFQYKGKVNIPDVELPKKIIATTNPELLGHYFSSDPQVAFNTPNKILQSDIEYIISLYNGKSKFQKNITGEDFCKIIMNNPDYDEAGNKCFELAKKMIDQDNADKKFTLEDIKEAWEDGETYGYNDDASSFEEYLKDKEQPKSNTVMVEYDGDIHDEVYRGIKPVLKDGCIVIIK